MNITERDRCICTDYQQDRKEVHELSRIYGLGPRRIQQILDAAGITRRKPGKRTAINREIERIGLFLYNYRFDRGIEVYPAAQELGWSIIRLRNVERGLVDLTFTELMDVAAYTQTPISEILKEPHGSS